jgi:hypothetical protein
MQTHKDRNKDTGGNQSVLQGDSQRCLFVFLKHDL